jgi:uncharacterized protein (DUF1330 family)
MKTHIVVAISSLIAGIAFGAAGFDVLHAQGKPPAYVITDFSEITDGQTLGVARDKMMAAVAKSGGNVLVRTNSMISIEGIPPKIFAVISFDGVDQAKAWFTSDAMKESNEARHKASTSRVFVVEGLTK